MTKLSEHEQKLVDEFERVRALAELKRRFPDDPDGNPCPDCGSFDHFECQ